MVSLTDGGRADAGFRGKRDAGDCVARSIAIASGLPYMKVYSELALRSQLKGGKKTARDGVLKKVYKQYLVDLGWHWHATMGIGTGCKVHLRTDELPRGALIVEVSKHVTCVIDGVIHDTHDPSRGGMRCVYGYWTEPA